MPNPTNAVRRPEILLFVLLSACLALLSFEVRRPNGQTVGEAWLLDAGAPFVRLVTGTRSGASDLKVWSSSRGHLLAENRALKQRLVEMDGELLRLRDADRDKTRMMELFNTLPHPPAFTRSARLIALETAGPFRTALLDRGTLDGIGQGGVVVGRGGLLGRIVAASPHTARVQLLTDRTAAVGVLFLRTGRAAVARGDGAGGVAVQYVPRSAYEELALNDDIVSAGTDGVYPKDLPIGRIADLRRSGNPLLLDLPVKLAADPNRESVIFVLPAIPLGESVTNAAVAASPASQAAVPAPTPTPVPKSTPTPAPKPGARP
ncbi:MAG: rod shape-determining protein MreC [Thermoanaerobaculia bacterium]